MDEEINKEPRERMHDIFAEDNEEQIPKYEQPPQEQVQPDSPPPAQPQPQMLESLSSAQPPQPPPQSPMEQLPKLKQAAPASSQIEPTADKPKVNAPKSAPPASQLDLGNLLQRKQPAKSEQTPTQQAAQKSEPQPAQQPTEQLSRQTDDSQGKQTMPRKEKLLRMFWTTTSVISMTVNVIVVIVLIVALWFLRGFKLPPAIDILVLNKLLSGLYSNFELMDAATISATIPVEDQIPVKFDLELKQPTTVTLSEDVTIRGAYVVINTPVIDINAPAVVTLPAGTNLPIYLDLIVPVDKQVPVNLNVAVEIPLNATELHTPFVGLQEVVKPLYCLVEPAAASSLTGQPVCK